MRNAFRQLRIPQVHWAKWLGPVDMRCKVGGCPTVIVACNRGNQPQTEIRMMTADSRERSFQICVIRTNNCLLIGASPCTCNQICSEVYVGFLLVKPMDQHTL